MASRQTTPEARRQFLLHALSSGMLVGGLGWQASALAGWFGKRPKKLPEGQSIFTMQGRVLVNGQSARRDTPIEATDQVEVGPGGQLIFAVGDNAYVLRERSILELGGKALFVNAMQLISGAVLGVFGKRTEPLTVHTRTATIGIRGTALYTAIHPGRTYACTCYGRSQLAAKAAPDQAEDIESKHHDEPRWILDQAAGANHILPAPMIDHSDMELMILEALCGREVPFATPPMPPGGPRRGY